MGDISRSIYLSLVKAYSVIFKMIPSPLTEETESFVEAREEKGSNHCRLSQVAIEKEKIES
jgi:hypothetical protein